LKALVSIILPVFNVKPYLTECLESIANQTYYNFELIAVNDGSTDDSLALLEQYAQKDGRIKIISQDNKGLSGARNTGLMHAKGHYIFFVDSDDYVAPELVEYGVASFKRYDADLVLFNHTTFDEATGVRQHKIKPLKEDLMSNRALLKAGNELKSDTFFPVWLYAYRNDFLKLSSLRFYEGILHEDILFTPTALSYANKVAILPECLYIYRKRAGSITTNPEKAQQSLKDHIFIANQLYLLSENTKDVELQMALNQLVASRYRFILEACERQQIGFDHHIYIRLVKAINSKKVIKHQYTKEFYQRYIETPKQKHQRECFEKLFKWPRSIYKYKISKIISLKK
jgi:glycosyltransferase involved in cell wall biosynthesis